MAISAIMSSDPRLPFEIHWSRVPAEDAAALAPDGRLLAIWPAPVNHDACFAAAGFTLFGDTDAAWDEAADGLLQRVIDALAQFGAATLLSKPLTARTSWYRRLFAAPRALPLVEQARLPMHWDSLPPFHARFGDDGAALRTGDGHVLLWVQLPPSAPDAAAFVRSVSALWPLAETTLRWQALLPGSPE
ncbi:MAG: hypothetical protein BGO82_10845 [Devosia sp. 67-54]|uniref:hypothetical protein n=1 Tax=unclassified Devosia TaxID=196773 RepID=UPI0009634F6B|nr:MULTISPECIES: hypothetical protein [unclassified Devosia]MBN9304867.1 hypothetical protein [Devosia sp.]OJX15181.1 MAG: hypothetical protein BGO82_10845 [Devosia sp. 67-54]